jgi:hypothetical protein
MPSRSEIWARGIDEALQGVGGDPFHGNASLGVRVPLLATQSLVPAGQPPQTALDLRYLLLLAQFTLGEDVEAEILGYRMWWELGVKLTLPGGPGSGFRIVRQEVKDPGFLLPDGNVSWHMTVLRGVSSFDAITSDSAGPPPGARNIPGIAWRIASMSGLLYEAITLPPADQFYVDLTAYTPPNKGRPFGEPIIDGFESFEGLRTEQVSHGAWNALHTKVKGPGLFGFYASVRQPLAAGQAIPVNLDPNNLAYPEGLSREEQFVSRFPPGASSSGARIWRVGGALAVRM